MSAEKVHDTRTVLRLTRNAAGTPSRRRVFMMVLDAYGLMAKPARSLQCAIQYDVSCNGFQEALQRAPTLGSSTQCDGSEQRQQAEETLPMLPT